MQVEQAVVGWCSKAFRCSMTVQTLVHMQGVLLRYPSHLFHSSMAGNATDPGFEMDGMVEIDKLRKIVNAVPAQWLVRIQAFPDRRQDWRLAQDDFVAIHARLRCWKTCKRRFFNGGVAKPAVQPQLRMTLVVEGNVLFWRNIDSGDHR